MENRQKLNRTLVFLTTFTSYTATHVIGEGGSGRIFETEADSGGSWAIKWLDPKKTTKEKVKRFKNEVLFCSNNQHQNILTIVDHGVLVTDGTGSPFYVMPLFSGSLRTLLKSGIAPNKALVYFAQMLDGVEAAHLQKVVHRDLKPENILYDSGSDRLIIADFGIAQFEEDELYTAVETKDSQRLANFQYAAPEQRVRGSATDHRADIYALGLMLNEMFTGKVPFGTGYETIRQAAPDYEYLDGIVEAMIRQSPQDRIGSIEGVKNQLIGRKNEFVITQRVSQLKAAVVPTTDTDDPLIVDPLRLVDADWARDTLTLVFQQPVNNKWIAALHNMGSHQSVLGKGPEAFSFRANKATVTAKENEAQRIVDFFKAWLPQANRVYEHTIRLERQKAEAAKRRELQQQIQELEARQRVLKNLKI